MIQDIGYRVLNIDKSITQINIKQRRRYFTIACFTPPLNTIIVTDWGIDVSSTYFTRYVDKWQDFESCN